MGLIADLSWRASSRLAAVAPIAELPDGAVVDLPGRGSTYLIDTGPPEPSGTTRPTLILLHALACTGLLTWYPVLPALRERYRVVLFDQRWHGQGIRAPRFTLEDCADDVAAVADLLGIDAFIPVGYSMGSLVAQLAWRRHPERVSAAVLGAATTSFTRADRDPIALTFLSTQIGRAAERRESRGRARATGQPRPPDDNRWAMAQFRQTPPVAVAGAAAVVSQFDSSAWIGAMRVPTALVVTTKDRTIVPARQHRLARSLPDVTVYEVDAGHAACVMNAARFTPALLAACASVCSRLADPAPR